jgi:hypothetical protein
MIKLSEILDELYSNPICPRKEGESDNEYIQRCAPLMGQAVLLNSPSVSEEVEEFDKVKYYEEYYRNLTPSEFDIKVEGNTIKITLPNVDEALTPMQKLARKRAMAGKKRMIQRKRQRTMLRKKGSKQLYKKAYKAAYRDVYEFFRNKLFPDVPKSELTIIQKKQIEKWVAKKKKKVLKRARFKYLPAFREKEAEKFGRKSNIFK